MARRRRRTARRRNTRISRTVTNPRRRRRRRHNPSIVARRRRVANPVRRRRRHHARRHNPSGLRIGEIVKDMIYGAGGAILTRVGAGAVQGFVPGSFASAPYMPAAVQAGVAVVGVRWLGKKFLGQKQGDVMMLGGLISAGLALADAYFPNIQSQLGGVFRLPVMAAPVAQIGTPVTGSGLGDVYDVDMVAAGFGDVEEVPPGMWS